MSDWWYALYQNYPMLYQTLSVIFAYVWYIIGTVYGVGVAGLLGAYYSKNKSIDAKAFDIAVFWPLLMGQKIAVGTLKLLTGDKHKALADKSGGD